ncbi:unnamed protein product [Staurois parvus]|uniref:Uncharacterized protein n=1 Tax=Staurois parvus TaxID=386267 RepID=A0ABN9G149_9NEOB|nr:unnamed protein product [Staurois parvus]
MGLSKELSEFKCCTVIGCHLCNKSIPEIMLLNIPWSTVSGNITTWKQLETIASHQLSAESIAKDLQTL